MTARSGLGSAGRGIWYVAMSCLVVLGLTGALMFIDWATLGIVFVVIVGLVAPIHLSIAMVTEGFTYGLLRMVVSWAVRAAVLILTLCGYAAAIGLATLPLLGLVALSAWFVFGVPRRREIDRYLSSGEERWLP